MTDKVYKRMLLRRRFCKKICLVTAVFLVSFCASILLFGNYTEPQLIRLTDLSRCPACYGVSICPELYSNQITLVPHIPFSNILNAKNIYYGYTKSNRPVVLKKLAHDWELNLFDEKLCGAWNLPAGCKPAHLLNATHVDEKIIDIVKFNLSWPDTEPRKGLVLCPYAYSLYDLLQPLFDSRKRNPKSEFMNIWTMLSINPEPILLQVMPKNKGWPVPAYAGVCGRLEVVADEGSPMSTMRDVAWEKKLKYAYNIINAAMDFTFKHERFRFYLMDWSLDNIVVNNMDDIAFVDLEDVIVVDKDISPSKDLPDWYQRYSREVMGPGFTFSIENMCKHHLSDHNLWAACYILAGDDNPYLYPIPEHVNSSRPHFERLLSQCLNGNDRFHAISKLKQVMIDMLMDVKIGHLKTVK